ncbi:MAG TPA: type II toxin-antitoxin system VapC family toxin [Candidatus Moranbacteria bacterium]|nr:type II toxin-antitoxin system VapC family toxin [Candidatus Moranbacteria bacterium]
MKKYKTKLVLDTNIFIRIFVGDIKSQMKECLELLKFLTENETNFKIYIPQVVILEIAWVLGGKYYGFSRKKISEALASLGSDDFKIIHKIDFNKGLKIFEKYNVKLGDAMIVANEVVQKENAIIVSYDRDFDKIKEVTRMTPKEALKKFTN